MSLTQNSHKPTRRPRNLYIYLALLIPVAVLSFWKSYFGVLNNPSHHATFLLHIHITTVFGWLFMLVAQAWLIRTGRRSTHLFVGRLSYVIAPVIILLGFAILHQAFNRTLATAPIDMGSFGMIAAFSITWTLAIVYRRKPALHIRFMISTAFAFATAIVFRIFYFWVPGFNNFDASTHANYSLIIFLLLLLIAKDWQRGIKRSPYWVITGVHGLTYLSYLTYAHTEEWLVFCRWYRDLF